MLIGREAWFFNGLWCGDSERGWRWRFLFNWVWARVLWVVKASVFIMSWSHDVAVRASIERAVFSVVSEVVVLGAEASFAMFCWCFFEGQEKGKCIELIEGMYDARLYGDFYAFNILVGFKVYGLLE